MATGVSAMNCSDSCPASGHNGVLQLRRYGWLLSGHHRNAEHQASEHSIAWWSSRVNLAVLSGGVAGTHHIEGAASVRGHRC